MHYDPNNPNTRICCEWNSALTYENLFQIDSPVPAGSKGSSEFLTGITDEMRRKHREAVLAVDVQGVKDTADQMCKSDAGHVGRTGIGPVNPDFEQNKDWTILKIE